MSSTQATLPSSSSSAMIDKTEGFNPLELLDIVLEHKWLVAAVTATGLAAGYAAGQIATPIYEASTVLQIENKGDSGLGAMLQSSSSTNTTATEIEIMRSRSIIGTAVKNLNLDVSVTPKYLPLLGHWLARSATQPSVPGFLGMPGYVSGNEAIELDSFAPPPSFISQSLVVRLTARGYLLLSQDGRTMGQGQYGKPLQFEWMGDSGTLQIKSAIGLPGAEFTLSRGSNFSVTKSLQMRLRVAENRTGTGIVTATLEDDNAERAAKVLNEIAAIFVSNSTQRKAAEAEKSITFLDELLPQLRKEVDANEVRLNQFRIEKGIFELSDEAQAIMEQSASQRIRLTELQQRHKEFEKRYTTEHPYLQALDSQIKALEVKIASLEGSAKKLPIVQQELLHLQREVKISDGIYTRLLETYQQLRLTKEGKLGNVRVVDPALKPQSSSKPNRRSMFGIGGLAGLALGLGLALLRFRMRPGIRHADELEQGLGLHVFATIPYSPAQAALAQGAQGSAQLLALCRPDDPAIESLRSLRTALQFALLDSPNNIVVLTGATPNIGKSFTSANFAAVLAATGKRVLLIDADMRKGHIHQFFGLERGIGLSELIAGSQTPAEVLRPDIMPGLDYISTGTLPPNPAELLMSTQMVDLLKSLSARYDLVVIDTPPVLAVSDTAALAPQAGAVFLVTRAEVSTLAEVQESVKRLEQSGASLRGAIFNGIDLSKRAYRYGDGYQYGGRYRYQYQSYNYGRT